MRSLLTSLVPTSLLCTSLLACTGPLEPESFELPDFAPVSEVALPDWDVQPEAAPAAVDPKAQPRLELHISPLGEGEDSEWFCGYDVVSRGFPAVDVEGTTLVHVGVHTDSNSEGEDAYMLLSWLSPERGTTEQVVYDRGDDFHWVGDETNNDCAQAIAELRTQVADINEQLAARSWLPLERLDVVDIDGLRAWGGEQEDDPVLALPLAQRPVEMLYRGQQFIVRVRQARVLLALERPQWQREDYFCKRSPNMRALDVDRRTGLALVYFDHSSGGCLCDDHQYVDALRLPPELLAEVDAHPSDGLSAW